MQKPFKKHGDHVQAVKLVKHPDLCPFCNAAGAVLRTEWRTVARRKALRHFYECWMCGARGGESEYPEGALLAWNGRPKRAWTPLPAYGGSLLLPGGQKYGHLLVGEGDLVSFIDYVEEEVSAEGNGVASLVNVRLGNFRVAVLREASNERGGDGEEGTPQT